jgi:integrase
MALRKRGKSWQVDALVGGVRVRRQFKTAAEAEAFDRSGKDVPDDHTLGEAFTMTCKSRWSGCRTGFMADMATRVLGVLGPQTKLHSITGASVMQLVSDLLDEKLSPASINRRLAALSAMLSTAQDAGWIQAKPKIKLLREPKGRNRYLTDEEEKELFAAIRKFNPRIHDLCVVLVDTGLRVSEAIGMEWKNVTPKDVVVHKTKNGESRRVPLTRRAYEHIAKQERVGKGPFEGIDRDRVSKVLAKAKARTSMANDVDVVPHILRHTCASRLIQRGAPTLVVKEWLGHKSLIMLERYAHLAPATLQNYVSVLDVSHGS